MAVTDGPASMCIKEEAGKYAIAFKDEAGKLIKEHVYDKKHKEDWAGHREIFFSSTSEKKTPEVRIGLTEAVTPGGSVILIGKSRHCLPESSVHELLKQL